MLLYSYLSDKQKNIFQGLDYRLKYKLRTKG